MARAGRRGLLAGGVTLLAMGALAWSLWGAPGRAPAGPGALIPAGGQAWAAEQQGQGGGNRIVLAFGVASVLTRDGMLWVYRPDADSWLTIDQAFEEEGRETHILPLPVAPGDIAQMESFGFLLTKGGEMWLYEFTSDQWRRIAAPPESR